MKTRSELLDLIESAREAKEITNDQATAASVALGLEGDEAMLAARLMRGGADPASLQYLADGHVSEKVALAHRAGPGIFAADDLERGDYLALCALSADEAVGSTLRERVNLYGESAAVSEDDYLTLAGRELDAIMALTFSEVEVARPCGGKRTPLRVYKSDRGFANAYWSGVPYAAVYFGGDEPYLYVCTNGSVGVEDLGLPLDKVLDANRGIIFSGETISQVMEQVA